MTCLRSTGLAQAEERMVHLVILVVRGWSGLPVPWSHRRTLWLEDEVYICDATKRRSHQLIDVFHGHSSPEQKTEVTLSLLHPFFTNLGLRWLGDCMSLATRCLNVSQRRLPVAASRPRWQWRRSNSSGVEVPPHLGLPTSHAEESPDISHPAQSIRIKPYYITTPIFYPNSGLSIRMHWQRRGY